MRSTLMLFALVGVGLVGAARADDGFGPVSIQPEAKSFHLGALQLTALHDAAFVVPNDAKVFGTDIGAPAVSDVLRAAGAPTDRLSLSVNALLVRTGKRVLLLDTGLGPEAHGSLLASLGAAGVAPASVTDVLLTHSHGDHAGGLLDTQDALAFPNATIRMASAEWAFLQKQGPAKLVSAIQAHVKTFEPGAIIAPGVTAVALEGHTPGHVGYQIVSGNARLLDIGDMAHSYIVSLAKPQWTMGFDSDPVSAKTTRQTQFAALAKDQELVFAPHFPFPGVGHIVMSGDAFAWQPGLP